MPVHRAGADLALAEFVAAGGDAIALKGQQALDFSAGPNWDVFHRRNPCMRVELVLGDRRADLAVKIVDATWAVYASRAYAERQGRPERPAVSSAICGRLRGN
jgi:hypothetical protein